MNTINVLGFDDDDDALAEFDRITNIVVGYTKKRGASTVCSKQRVSDTPFPFMRLPQELRECVYDEYFRAEDRLDPYELSQGFSEKYEFEFTLLRANKQIWLEALRSWRKNAFVRIETPWPHAVHHIRSDGQVPIVAVGSKADEFSQHTALIQITAPLYGVTVPEHTIILHIDDLPKFTKVWYYSALNSANLNPHICLTFTLRDPYYPADPKPVPLALQRKLLLPFEDVKGLYEVVCEGYDESVVSELRKRMAIPYPTVQESCEAATRFLEEGDLLLTTNRPKEALDAYVKAFDAVHIKIQGRRRHILADGHFTNDITTGRYAGQHAMTVRVTLRIRLVPRVMLAYLHLGRPAETAFWGMRSIRLLYHGTSGNDTIENFFIEVSGSGDVASIFAFTATALEFMERDEQWRGEWEQYRVNEEGIPDRETMWQKAGAYLASEKCTADRKRIAEEVRKLGGTIADGFWGESGADEADSMAHLHLRAHE